MGMARLRSNTRVVAIVLAVILAGVAAYALLSYIRGVETRTQEDFDPVDAYVAAELIPAGTSANAAVAGNLIELRSVPSVAVPQGAVGDLAQLEGTVAVVDILPGEVLVADRFGTDVIAPRGLREIPQDKEAISVEVGVVQGVAGFISPGDQVSVIAELTIPDELDEPEEPAEGEEAPPPVEPTESIITQYLLQDVEVLAVGRRVILEGEDQVQQTEQVLMTLALDPEDAEKLVFAWNNGALHFTLLPPEVEGSEIPPLERPVETPGRSFDTIFED
jgi:pilus assembly protein CpaB